MDATRSPIHARMPNSEARPTAATTSAARRAVLQLSTSAKAWASSTTGRWGCLRAPWALTLSRYCGHRGLVRSEENNETAGRALVLKTADAMTASYKLAQAAQQAFLMRKIKECSLIRTAGAWAGAQPTSAALISLREWVPGPCRAFVYSPDPSHTCWRRKWAVLRSLPVRNWARLFA